MADEKLNQDQDQAPEETEETPSEMDENDLEQVSGGATQGQFNRASKVNRVLHKDVNSYLEPWRKIQG